MKISIINTGQYYFWLGVMFFSGLSWGIAIINTGQYYFWLGVMFFLGLSWGIAIMLVIK